MSYKRSEKPKLRPITIRFSAEAWDAIDAIAKEHNTNKTELVRMAVAGNLARYLGDIRIIDTAEAKRIKKLIKRLLNETANIKTELHRIGVNYNQEIRLKQIERKYADRGIDVNAMMTKYDETEKVKSECKGFSKDDLEALISRYEQATKQVGEILCRILI